MPAPTRIHLNPHETIVGIVPEYVAGPGWSNAPVWVTVLDWQTQQARRECIQPKERTAEMHALFGAGAAMWTALLDAVPATKAKR